MVKILIVEDSLVSQRAIIKFLGDVQKDITFLTASNGEEGLTLYQREPVDLIILDLLMPKMDGQRVLERIRDQDRETKVAIITANIQSQVKEEIEELGVLSFINKPFTREKAEELIQRVKKDDPS